MKSGFLSPTRCFRIGGMFAVVAATMLCLPPAPAQSGGSGEDDIDDPINYNPDPKVCCDCISMYVAGVSNEVGQGEGKLWPSKEGSYLANATVIYAPTDACVDPVNATVVAILYSDGAEVSREEKSVRLTDGSRETLAFTLEPDKVREGSTWDFYLVCPYGNGNDETGENDEPFTQFVEYKEGCTRISVPLGAGCQSCSDGACAPNTQSDSFRVTIPTTRSNGGQTDGELFFYAPGFSNPGREGLFPNVSPDFVVNYDGNDLITSVQTGAGTVEIAAADGALLALDPKAFVVTHKDPSGTIFRTTTISFVNEGGADRFRMDTVFDGTTTRHEQTRPQAGTLVLEKGHVVSGAFEPIWRETFVETVPAAGKEVQRRTVEERATAASAWSTTSDVEATWERQIFGWVKTKQIIDPGGEALTSTWEYYQPGDVTGPGGSTEGLGRLKQYLGHDGSEEFRTYELRKSSVTTPYAGNPTGKTTTTTWNPGTRTRTVEVTVGGNTLSKTVTANTDTSTSATVYTSASETLTTTTHYVASGQDFGGMPERVEHPDGTLTTYAYSRDATTGGYTAVMEEGATSDGTTVSEGMRTTTTVNSRGTTIYRKTAAIGFGSADGETFDLMAVTSVDDLGRALTTAYYPASATVTGEQTSATGAKWTTNIDYSCCGIASETDKYGITTYHAYDSLRRRIKTNRLGVTTEMVHDGLTTETHRYADAVTGSLSATLVDDDANLIGKTTRNLAGTFTTSSSPDPTSATAGDLVDTTTATTYEPVAGLSRRVVVTTPDNFTQTTDYYLDGRTHKTTGDLSPAMENAYSVNATGELTTRGYIVGTGHNEVTGTQTDHAGRVLLSGHLSSLGSSVFQSSVSTEYNGLGQMVKSVDPDGVTALMLYNTRGERTITATDLNDNDAIDYGTDSVSFSETVPALDGNNNPVWQTVSKVWQDGQTSAAGGTVVSTSLRSPDGLSAFSQSVGVSNPATSLTTLAGGGAWTTLTTNPDGTDTLQTYTAGLLASTASRDSSDATIESMIYGYDNFNRQTTSTHSRTGSTTTAYLSATADVVASVTDSNNRVTAFTYDVRGRRTEVDAPDTLIAGGTSTNITITAYNPDSTVQETTGAQTYRVTYEYDYADRRKTMITYGTTTAETEWFYSPDRGFMTRKEYADDEGTDYTYTAAGRLATRTWARGVVTTYGYDDGGRLTSTDYSDATPDLAFTYDPLNRQKTVTRGGVLHASYTYDPADLVLAAERQQIDTLNRTIERSYDAFLRPTGHTAGTPDGTDPFIVDTVEATATWTRDTAGRLATVTGGSDTFTYGYTYEVNGAGNHQGATAGTLFESAMPFTLDGPRVDTALEYDATRNALLGRTNTYPGGSGTLSDFAYSVNAIGQRDGLTTTGDAFATDLNWAWAYNIRGELVQADDQSTAGNDRAYEFDGIGNRLFSEISSTEISDPAGPNTTTYTPNALNQYTAIGSQSPVHDDDGNLTSGPLPAAPGTTSTLVWDAENRLISATVGTTTTTYTYDHLSRLTSVTTGTTTVRYLYDGWNRIAEYNGTTQIAAYLWGLDLSGTPQGAGGVGGLLAISAIASGSISDTFYPAYDGNGNVSEYVNAAGAEVAHFEYDPFGNLTVDAAMNAASFPYRFSTKPQDEVTGLYYYGFRFYDPVTGRWSSRDPIGERGGVNLYGFVGNNGVGRRDYLGLSESVRLGSTVNEGYTFEIGAKTPDGKTRFSVNMVMEQGKCKIIVEVDVKIIGGVTQPIGGDAQGTGIEDSKTYAALSDVAARAELASLQAGIDAAWNHFKVCCDGIRFGDSGFETVYTKTGQHPGGQFNNRTYKKHDCCCDLEFRLTHAGNAGNEIGMYRDPSKTAPPANQNDWNIGHHTWTKGQVAAHEFGHWLGNVDEYNGAKDGHETGSPDKPYGQGYKPGQTIGVMEDPSEPAQPRNLWRVMQQINGSIMTKGCTLQER